MPEQPAVSVNCICYNHAKYLHQALDSVLCQKTTFPYEILIHDDASTDGSQEIIREYMSKYPNRIRAVLQTVNQYSQGKFVSSFLTGMARGKYLITLECDDFWQDNYKLQKQVNALEAHPECSMCVHRTELFNEDGTSKKTFVPEKQLPEGVLAQDGLVEYIAEIAQFHTSSRMIPAHFYKSLDEAPYFTQRKHVGDLPLILHLSQKGPFYYIPDAMTGYRISSDGSYSRHLSEDTVFFCSVRKELREMWQMFGECHPRYRDISLQQADDYGMQEVQAKLSKNSKVEYKLVHQDPYLKYYNKLPVFVKVKAWIRSYLPQVVTVWKKIKQAVKVIR